MSRVESILSQIRRYVADGQGVYGEFSCNHLVYEEDSLEYVTPSDSYFAPDDTVAGLNCSYCTETAIYASELNHEACNEKKTCSLNKCFVDNLPLERHNREIDASLSRYIEVLDRFNFGFRALNAPEIAEEFRNIVRLVHEGSPKERNGTVSWRCHVCDLLKFLHEILVELLDDLSIYTRRESNQHAPSEVISIKVVCSILGIFIRILFCEDPLRILSPVIRYRMIEAMDRACGPDTYTELWDWYKSYRPEVKNHSPRDFDIDSLPINLESLGAIFTELTI